MTHDMVWQQLLLTIQVAVGPILVDMAVFVSGAPMTWVWAGQEQNKGVSALKKNTWGQFFPPKLQWGTYLIIRYITIYGNSCDIPIVETLPRTGDIT